MKRGDRRHYWRMYWRNRHHAEPYPPPAPAPSWLERTWIRIFG